MSGKVATPHCEAALSLLRALGIDYESRSIAEVHIHLKATGMPTVDVIEHVCEGELGEVATKLSQYRLTPRGQE